MKRVTRLFNHCTNHATYVTLLIIVHLSLWKKFPKQSSWPIPLLSQTSLRLKDLAKFIVLTVSHSQASRYAPLHYRSIQQSRIASLSSNLTWQDYIQLTGPAMRDLKCWFNCPPPPQTHHCLRT